MEVSQLGGEQGFSQGGVTFAFHTNISTLRRIEPSWAQGGDDIRVFGSAFNTTSECFFGGFCSPSTVFVSENELGCTVPNMGPKSPEIVQVASDPTHLPGGHVMFHYECGLSDIDSPAVREVPPSNGPTTGGTLVTVYGVEFPEDALCRFGDLFVISTRVSDKEIQCVGPQHRAATVVLEVISRDHSFSASYIRFTYFASSGLSTCFLFLFLCFCVFVFLCFVFRELEH